MTSRADRLKGLVKLAGVRVAAARGQLARVQSEQRLAEQALAAQQEEANAVRKRQAQRRRGMMEALLEGPVSPARLARLPLTDAMLAQEIEEAERQVKAARDNLAKLSQAALAAQAEVAKQLQKQRKIEIANEQLVIRDLSAAEVAEEMMD